MTKQGFYSIVQHKQLADRFTVRSRARKDLENILARVGEPLTGIRIVETPHNDYAYRIIVTGEQKAAILDALGKEIDYPNFKSEIARRPDQANKLEAYHDIWSVMYRTQKNHVSQEEYLMNESIILVPSKFQGTKQVGDFSWMIEQPEFADALFIFNDNESQFRAHQTNPRSEAGCAIGGGNAIIRPYQCTNPPRSAGVPTGDGGGYRQLTAEVKAVIDESIVAIGALLASGRYRQVFYSATNEEGELGSGIFDIGADVKAYIVAELRRVVAKFSRG
ncbi:hypothetical protein [Armatimonas sp.]|uniref:hypothetical protein n=1 Tax=Armatimonas sp. TaxID=1872638 RepID=UPI00374D3312